MERVTSFATISEVEQPRLSLTWVGSNRFEIVFGGAILINAAVVVVETDHRDTDKFSLGWFLSDSVFTLIFLVEMVLRLVALRWRWFRNAWYMFDAFLVFTSVMDVWFLPIIQQNVELRALMLLRVIRLFRMLRILRILRLFRFAHQLVLLVHALWGAVRAMLWAMILVVLVLYIFAMVLTRLVQVDDALKDDPNIEEWFGSLARSLFTLFQLMTLEGWPDIARATLETSPWLTIFYVTFIVVTNITLLNTVAGVLTENVLSTSRKEEDARQLRLERELEEEMHAAGEDLAAMDTNGDGRLDLDELRAASMVPGLSRFLDLAGLSAEQAEELFNVVDYENRGSVHREDFVEAVRLSRGPIKSKHLVGVKRDIAKLHLELSGVSALLEQVSQRADVICQDSDCNFGGVVEEFPSPGESGVPERMAVGGLHRGIDMLRRDFHFELRRLEDRLQAAVAAAAVARQGHVPPMDDHHAGTGSSEARAETGCPSSFSSAEANAEESPAMGQLQTPHWAAGFERLRRFYGQERV